MASIGTEDPDRDETPPKRSSNDDSKNDVDIAEASKANKDDTTKDERNTRMGPSKMISSVAISPDEEDRKKSSAKFNDNNDDDHDDDEAKANSNNEDNKEGSTRDELPSRPIKRARTAYFIFTEEKRQQVQAEHSGEGVAAIAKVMGHMWGAMSEEEKSIYQQKAAEERERVAKELEAWKAAGGKIELEKSGGSTRDPNSLIFPVGKIRKIAKLDPEVRNLSKEAIALITKCAELALAKLGEETVRVARLQNRRKLLPEDVANVCGNREQFLFLKDDVKDLVKSQIEQQKQLSNSKVGGAPAKKSDAARDAAAAGSKPLTSYFGSVSKK